MERGNMKSVRLVVAQFSDPVAGKPAMEPFLMVVQDDPHWKALLASIHGAIPSAMHVVELGHLEMDRNSLVGLRMPISSIVDMYLGGLHAGRNRP
jgi:hypothetical protein